MWPGKGVDTAIITKYIDLKLDPHPGRALARAARILRRGGLVAFPTETVYGLGANALDGQAVARIFAAKGRPADNPLIVHLARVADLDWVAREVPPLARRLAADFWPGPLTLVLPRGAAVAAQVTAGLDTVAVRVPAHPVARQLIELAGVPVAAPSANRSGKPSPTTGRHALHDLAGRVEMILDAGPARVGVESTVLDLTRDPPVLLRPGGLARETLAAVAGVIDVDPALLRREGDETVKPRSPGMKYRHYAPEAAMYLVAGSPGYLAGRLPRLVAEWQEQGRAVAVLISRETAAACTWSTPPASIEILGGRGEADRVARRLFGALRRCDQRKVAVILAEAFPATGLGAAVMNRLKKAAYQELEI